MRLRYTDRAKEDIEKAVLWYERQRKNLGFEFLDCIKQSEELIITNPELYAISHSSFRGCIVKRFPFSIYYTIESTNKIIVHSVFDNRQDPEKKP